MHNPPTKHTMSIPSIGNFAAILMLFISIGIPLWLRSRTPPNVAIGDFCNLATSSVAFIPLINAAETPLQLDGWMIGDHNGTTRLTPFTVPPHTVVRIWSGAEHAYPEIKPQYWLLGITNLPPSAPPTRFVDLYVGRVSLTWEWSEVTLKTGRWLGFTIMSPTFRDTRCDFL